MDNEGQLSIQILETRLIKVPTLDRINQFLRIFHGDDEEYETEPHWDCGMITEFNQRVYNLNVSAPSED